MSGKRSNKHETAGNQAESAVVAKNEAPAEVELPADCRMAALAPLKARLEEVLCLEDIVLDVAAVERVDTAALQLLVLFRRDLESRGGKLTWHGSNEVLSEAAGLLGLDQLLTLPAATLA